MVDNANVGAALLRSLGTEYSIAMGYDPLIQQITKFGENNAVGTSEEDIWSLGGTETLLTVAAALFLSSTNTGDTSQVFQVEGLDANWAQQTGFATANGQNQVEVKDAAGGSQTWVRMFIAHQISVVPTVAGDIYIA